MIDQGAMDSDEERQFYAWLLEADKVGLVTDIEYHPKTFELIPRATRKKIVQLKTKTKIVDQFLFHPHVYTPDFLFSWCGKGCPFIKANGLVWVDVKGGGSRFHDGKQFSINQKLTFEKYGIYINKVIPENLFKKTWVPEACRYSPKIKKPVKKYIGVGDVGDYSVASMNK